MDYKEPCEFIRLYLEYDGVAGHLVRRDMNHGYFQFIEAPSRNVDLTSESTKQFYPNRWMYFWPKDVFEEFARDLLTSHGEYTVLHESVWGNLACARHNRHLSGKAGLPPHTRFLDGQMLYHCTRRELDTLDNLLYWVAGNGSTGFGVIVNSGENWHLAVEGPQSIDWIFRFSGKTLYFFMKDGVQDDAFLVARFHPHKTTS